MSFGTTFLEESTKRIHEDFASARLFPGVVGVRLSGARGR